MLGSGAGGQPALLNVTYAVPLEQQGVMCRGPKPRRESLAHAATAALDHLQACRSLDCPSVREHKLIARSSCPPAALDAWPLLPGADPSNASSYAPLLTDVRQGRQCPRGMYCVRAPAPFYGFTTFDNILAAWLSIFQTITQEG